MTTRAGTKAEREAKLKAHFTYVQRQYGLTEAQWREMYKAQGGRCAICRVASGRGRLLAVDHDHRCSAGHPPEKGCPKCVRGLVCSGSKNANTCNRLIAFYSRDALLRAAGYLARPPAREVLGAPSVAS